jgi:hypothetical protein
MLNPLLGFALFPAHQVVFVPAVILVILLVRERWLKRLWLSTLALALMGLLSYSFYYFSLEAPDRLYTDLMKVVPPVFTVLLLYWMRWWAARPPRIWADQWEARR